MIKKILISGIIFFVLIINSTQAVAEKIDIVEAYMREASSYRANGEYSKAIETYRKILYLQPINSNAAFLLAESLFSEGSYRKAQKEYKYYLGIVEKDKTLSAKEKARIKIKIKKQLEFISAQKNDIEKTVVSGGELFMLFWGLVTAIVLIVKLISLFFLFLEKNKVKKNEEKIWIDRYWLRRKEKEIIKTRVIVIKILIYVILITLIVLGARTLYLYRVEEINDSIKMLFHR